MRLSSMERLLVTLGLLCGLACAWQLFSMDAENSFADGICAALGAHELPPEARAMRLFHWVSTYDDRVPAFDTAAPRGPVTPRSMVEHASYFRANCGRKAWLLAILAQRCGLRARELRLCDASHTTRHVVCEVSLHGRWAVFDPTTHLEFRRGDGQLATAAEMQDPRLLVANAARDPGYDPRHWRFEHAERLHFEKLPFIGGWIRRIAPQLTGRPAEELALPAALQRPRLVIASTLALFGLLPLAAVGIGRRRVRRELRPARDWPAPPPGFALEVEPD